MGVLPDVQDLPAAENQMSHNMWERGEGRELTMEAQTDDSQHKVEFLPGVFDFPAAKNQAVRNNLLATDKNQAAKNQVDHNLQEVWEGRELTVLGKTLY